MSSSNTKKRNDESSDSSSPEKKSKTESSTSEVRVQIQYYLKDYYEEEEDEEYIDVEDEAGSKKFHYKNLGCPGDYGRSSRHGNARVLLEGKEIGRIDFILINRNGLGRGGLTFWEVCDSESADLEQIAAKLFNYDGTTKATLKSRLNNTDKADQGRFLYISKTEFDEPYGKSATPENVEIAATAIQKLTFASAFSNDGATTLAMYIPECFEDNYSSDSGFSQELHDSDMRKFTQAGYKSFHLKNPSCTYMFCELIKE